MWTATVDLRGRLAGKFFTRGYEYAWHEANYSFRDILSGARILEQDVREGRVPEPTR